MEKGLSDLDPDLPEVEPDVDNPADEEWLFDAQRDYWAQLRYYKLYQQKPLPQEKKKLCEFCGEEFFYAKGNARYCSRRCGLKVWRAQQAKDK